MFTIQTIHGTIVLEALIPLQADSHIDLTTEVIFGVYAYTGLSLSLIFIPMFAISIVQRPFFSASEVSRDATPGALPRCSYSHATSRTA